MLAPYRKTIRKKVAKRYDFSIENLEQSLDQSLKRLRSDYVDIFLLHSPPISIVEKDIVFEKLEDFKSKGKILKYGISPHLPEEAILFMEKFYGMVYQIPFNVLEQKARDQVFGLSSKTRSNLIARLPFGRGMLTSYGTLTTGVQYADEKQLAELREKRSKLEKFINERNKTWIELCIHFIWNFPEVGVIIPGTTSIRHLKENVESTEKTSLSPEEMSELDRIVATFKSV